MKNEFYGIALAVKVLDILMKSESEFSINEILEIIISNHQLELDKTTQKNLKDRIREKLKYWESVSWVVSRSENLRKNVNHYLYKIKK